MNDRPTIIDVARHAGVSKSTVSRVISGDGSGVSEATRLRVETAIAEIEYEHNAVASSLRTNRTNTVMLAIPDIANPFWPDVARGVQDVMDGEEMAVVFANSDWNGQREKAFLRMASRNRFDGMLINPIEVSNDELLGLNIATVLIGSHEDYPDFDTVGSDSYDATCLALDYLTSLGHRHIGLIHGRRHSRPGHSRLRAFLDYGREKHLPVDESYIVDVPFDLEGGKVGLHHLLALPQPPTAVLGANDILALGALQAAHEGEMPVPQALSIVGMDDIFAAATATPPLTTLAKPKYEIGRKAAELLLQRIQGQRRSRPRRHIFSCTLQRRSSTGPAPAADATAGRQ